MSKYDLLPLLKLWQGYMRRATEERQRGNEDGAKVLFWAAEKLEDIIEDTSLPAERRLSHARLETMKLYGYEVEIVVAERPE